MLPCGSCLYIAQMVFLILEVRCETHLVEMSTVQGHLLDGQKVKIMAMTMLSSLPHKNNMGPHRHPKAVISFSLSRKEWVLSDTEKV